MRYFLGADAGGTRTRFLICDESGQVVGFYEAGPGNHQMIGFDGLHAILHACLQQVLERAGISADQIKGAGFSIAGYDWPCEYQPIMDVIATLGLRAPWKLVNDAIPGLVAGTKEGWGLAVVSGTGCNCRGWDRAHQREGRVTGYGIVMGEAAGGSELVFRAMQLVGYAWSKRIPATTLTRAFIEFAGARDAGDLLEGYTKERYHIGASEAPIVFRVAEEGDQGARDLIRWAGCQLGEMAIGVIRQLDFENEQFEVVLSGSMFDGGSRLIEPMQETILRVAPGASFIRLLVPPVIGSIIIGMEQAGIRADAGARARLAETLKALHVNGQLGLPAAGRLER
jgi:N-acetylglucosamine kinase-like BadF-type ATPase